VPNCGNNHVLGKEILGIIRVALNTIKIILKYKFVPTTGQHRVVMKFERAMLYFGLWLARLLSCRFKELLIKFALRKKITDPNLPNAW
jgi:hypothetical protein